ncbi:MAG: DNA-processing protein DprA [Candidatus Omnitrophica bacterium]|nr:DNA-processing protein DprA [Candidatus Omnitrophota bacterium]
MAIRKITLKDAEYPENLRNIHTPPKQLFVNGTLLGSDETAVAVVGSRRASIYGLETAEKLAFELAARGITVVSGMAVGIDSAAHKGALKAKGRTIAVMAGGHNHIYPKQNKKLYEEIAAAGAVITEYEDDRPTLPQQFPARNRIISGLSLGVVIVEAAKNSGALITANFAAEQGRTVFAVPGRVSSGTSSGTNELIKDGACLVQSVDDILQELSLAEIEPVSGPAKEAIDVKISRQSKAYIYNSLTEDERKIYKNLSDEPAYIDEILEKTGMEHPKASKILLDLELKKLISQLPGKQFIKKGN